VDLKATALPGVRPGRRADGRCEGVQDHRALDGIQRVALIITIEPASCCLGLARRFLPRRTT